MEEKNVEIENKEKLEVEEIKEKLDGYYAQYGARQEI